MQCIRCDNITLNTDAEPFYRCPVCCLQFRLHTNGKLVERWLGPISTVLYPVQYESLPQSKAAEIAEQLYQATYGHAKTPFRRFTPEQLTYLIQELELELNSPAQQVADILTSRASEAELRAYMAQLVIQLKHKIAAY
ncbi:hypothetical protein L9G15_18325 [Shewanella sp. A3A]|nr:hypothetical protein [Shewanella ferrihydritica]